MLDPWDSASPLTPMVFRQWCRWCRQMFPTNYPVRVRRRPLKKDCGFVETVFTDETCTKMESHKITIASRLDRQATSDTLLHEWTHVLVGEDGGDFETHSAAFWEKHGELYRAWHRTA